MEALDPSGRTILNIADIPISETELAEFLKEVQKSDKEKNT